MQKLISRKEAFDGFIAWRKKLNNAADDRNAFFKLFDDAVKKAGEGDAILQDVVSYYYKNGVERLLNEDYKKHMQFEILSGSQGNEFAIEKLQFFFGNAYDQIVEHPDFSQIKYYNGIDEYNYISIIGQRLCESLVEKLNISAETLAKGTDKYDPYRPEYFRDYRKAVDEIIPITIEKMKTKQ